MILVATFLTIFVAGPALFLLLACQSPTRGRIAVLMVVALVLMVAALALGRWAVPAYAPSPYPGLMAIISTWLAWVVVLAYFALAIQRRLTSPRGRTYTRAIFAMATTLPWFGLYTAQMMADR